MKKQIVQLEKHDDVVSVRDRLGLLQADRVLLVLPRKGGILQKKLDLVLIQRAAVRMNTQVGLVTDDFIVIEHADALGIPVFYSIRESQRLSWAGKPTNVFAGRADRPDNSPNAAEMIAKNRQAALLIPPEFMAVRRVLEWFIFAIAIIVLLFGMYVVVPGARVNLKPASDQVSVTIPVIADPDPEMSAIDLVNRAIPARIIGVEVEWSTTIPTTGEVEEPNTKARGEVIFSNLLAEEVLVPAGTVVRTSADADVVRFQTTEDVLVPAGIAATAAGPIEALDAFIGPVGNVDANLINRVEGPLGVRLGVSNPARTRGGGVTETAAVSQEDYERLRSTLLQQLQQRAYAEMLASDLIGPSEFVSTESLAVVLVLGETYSEYIGQPAETISLEMRVVVQGVVINEPYARQVAYSALAERVGPGSRILDDTLTFTRGDELTVDDDRRVTFLMTCTGDVAIEINPDRVREMVSGQATDKAAYRLSAAYPLVSEPSFELWPNWFGRMPLLPIRIDVNVDYTRQ